jgi:tellurite resistance protein
VTPSQKNIVKALIAVAWADGKLEGSESGVIEGMLWGFDASEAEERELLEYARVRRTLQHDAPLSEMGAEDRETLLANAALLTHADGQQSAAEARVLDQLVGLLGFERAHADAIITSAHAGAVQLSQRQRDDDPL